MAKRRNTDFTSRLANPFEKYERNQRNRNTNVYSRSPRRGGRPNADGTVSSHLMRHSRGDNAYYAYPSLFQDKDGTWHEIDDSNFGALEEAKKRNELYEFKTEEDADEFAGGSWKDKIGHGTVLKNDNTMKKTLARKLWLGGAINGAVSGGSTGAAFAPPWGAIAGAVIGAVGGGIGASKRKKKEQELEEQRAAQVAKMEDDIRRSSDMTSFRDYAGTSGSGFDNVGYYAKGGPLKLARPDVLGVRQDPTKGGYIDNAASNAGIAKGRSHEQGGIKLPGAEIEGGETVVASPFTGETQVHSEELGVSDQTNKLVQRKGQIEQQLSRVQDKLAVIEFDLNTETTSIRRNSYQRQFDILNKEAEVYQQEIQTIDAQVEQLYQQQEGMKQGVPTEEQSPMPEGRAGVPIMSPDQEKLMAKGGEYQDDRKLATPTDTITYQNIHEQNIGLMRHLRKYDYDAPGLEELPYKEYLSTSYVDGKTRGNTIPKATVDSLYRLEDTPENRKNAMKLFKKHKRVDPTEELKYGGKIMNDGGPLKSISSISGIIPTKAKGLGKMNINPFSDRNNTLNSYNKKAPFDFKGITGVVGKIGKYAELAAPFIDNITNNKLNKRLRDMEIPEPIMDRANYLDPTHDVSGQLAAIDDYTNQTSKGIMDNVSDSRIGRSLHGSVQARGVGMKGQVFTDKINQERSVRNMNRQISDQVDMSNIAKLNQYNLAKFDKDVQTDFTNPSQNMAQVRDEIIGLLDRRDMKNFQDKQIALQGLLSGDTGVFERNILNNPLFSDEEKKAILSKMATINKPRTN